jgi:hypothetical protein
MEIKKTSISLSIGTVKTSIEYKNEEEKNVFLQVARELNLEYNKVVMMLGNIDENILLFYMLLITEFKLRNIKQNNIDELLLFTLKSISNFIQNKNNANDAKVKENLAVINIIKRVELNKKSENVSKKDDESIVMVEEFIENIKNDIRGAEKEILEAFGISSK